MIEQFNVFLKNLRLNAYYKPLFALSSLVLIASLFITLVGDQTKIQVISFFCVLYTIIVWLVDDLSKLLERNIRSKNKYRFLLLLSILTVIMHGIILLVFLWIFYKNYLSAMIF